MAPKSPRTKKPASNTQIPPAPEHATALPPINYGEAQAEEIEVLKAIYMEDYEEVEVKGAWSKTTDRSFKLTLRSFTDPDSRIVLSVRFTATYPKSAPLLDLCSLDAYHERTQKRIRNIVQQRPKQLLGEVMIHAIANEIQEALEDAVTARQQGTLPSLEEERASAEEVAAALAKQAEEAEALRQREAQAEEDRILQQMVDVELNRRENRKPAKEPPRELPVSSSDNAVSFDQPAVVEVGAQSLHFNTVTLLGALPSVRNEPLNLGRAETGSASATSLVAVKQLKLRRPRDEIMQIESVLETVQKLRHSAVLGLLAYRIDRLDNTSSQVTLCSQYADRGTLNEMLQLGTLHISKARQFTIELLEALDYLHRNGATHGNISCESIYFCATPSLAPKLGHMGQWVLSPSDSDLPSKWRAPEGDPQVMSARRKTDVWQLGVVVAQMFLGLDIVSHYQSPQLMLGRLDVSDSFDDFARKLFTTDAKKRPSAFDLLPVEFLRTDTPVLGTRLQIAADGSRRASSSILGSAARRSRHNSSNALEAMSRYAADFTEVGRLGKGGFGEVVKARNKLDGGIYAVKKIKQAPQLLDQVISEVMLLNRLNHPYVVRYFSTWVESDVVDAISEDATTTTEAATEETDADTTDGPRMDFGYQSAGGLDFISSSGYPQIEFGDDEDDEDASLSNSSSDNEESSDAFGNGVGSSIQDDGAEVGDLRLRKSRSDTRRLPSILYIQMEYCERQTLRDLIRKGLTTDESWMYARQITEGLAHIHNHGIIHRDLKPDNIFIDLAGNPKIGDFGLATTGQYQLSERAATMSGRSGGDMTRSVGTTLYVAPELRSASSTSYNDKVDMYSLGIMFFEMCERFDTAMERIRSLQRIREKDCELPQEYRPNGEKAAQGKLIACLISHKPSERPSSTELLRSDVLPIKIEDETIRQALSGLSDPRSPYHQKMMSALFAHDPAGSGRVKALAWDAKEVVAINDAQRMRLRAVARQSVEGVFRRHGAEETRDATTIPRSSYYSNANVVQLLDASGNLLQLPYDLTLPHARQLSKYVPEVKRTYVFGTAYRDAFTGGPPRVSEEVDFDIAMTGRMDRSAFDDAEVLKVMDEIVCELPLFASNSNVSFHLNHATILDAVLEHCRVPKAQQAAVKETVSRLGFHQWTWPKVRVELRKFGLPDTTLNDLQQFDFRDVPEKVFTRLRGLFNNASTRLLDKLQGGISALNEIIRICQELSLQRKLYIAPLGSINAKFYEGAMLFQCVLERKSNRTVIAAGGRYDSLIQSHRTMSSAPACTGAVGVSIGLDPVLSLMAKHQQGSKSSFLKQSADIESDSKRCDVLVEAGTEGAWTAAVRMLTLLWSSGISAELAVENRVGGSIDGHSFIVTVRHEASNTVRVTSTAADAEDIDIPTASLVSHLKQELREKEGNKVRPTGFLRQTSHHDNESKSNVQVLMAQHRSKKSNKFHIVEAAQQRWSEKLDEWKDAQILAVETRDEVLNSIGETRLSDPESWRKVIQGAPLNERQYLQQAQNILGTWRKKWAEGDGARQASVFNFRTGHCIYYDVGL